VSSDHTHLSTVSCLRLNPQLPGANQAAATFAVAVPSARLASAVSVGLPHRGGSRPPAAQAESHLRRNSRTGQPPWACWSRLARLAPGWRAGARVAAAATASPASR